MPDPLDPGNTPEPDLLEALAAGELKGDARLRAVRSRHDYLQMAIPGFVAEPNVSQHYGECEPTE